MPMPKPYIKKALKKITMGLLPKSACNKGRSEFFLPSLSLVFLGETPPKDVEFGVFFMQKYKNEFG